MRTPDTSVVIPCYNCDAYLPEALDSVFAQTRPVREIMVIDDGSTCPAEIPERLTNPKIRLVRTANGGAAAARNLGISLSSGKYVAFLDADDAWHPRKIEIQEDALDRCEGAVGAFTHTDKKEGWLAGPIADIRAPDPSVTEEQFWVSLWRRNFIVPSTVMVRRAAMLQAGGFSTSVGYCEDWEMWFRLLRIGRFVHNVERLTYYRRHSHQLTKNNYDKWIRYRRLTRQAIMAQHGDRLVQAGVSKEEQIRQSAAEYRGELEELYYFGKPPESIARPLWRYMAEYPTDVGMLKYALLSLFPVRLRELVKSACRTIGLRSEQRSPLGE